MATVNEAEFDQSVAILRNSFTQYPDFPKRGILFFDCLPIFENPQTFNLLLDLYESHLAPLNPTVIVGLDARGFIFAPALALRLNVRFIPIRKRGKLPGECVQAKYVKEYGEDVFEMQKGKLKSEDRVVVVDDLIATGGSAKATAEIINQLGATLLEFAFIMELTFLQGWKNLEHPVWRLVTENENTKAGYASE